MRERTTTGLRYGWTTGTCAAAAAGAAAAALLGLGFPDAVRVRLPRGGEAMLEIAERATGAGWACAGVVKDAGDDPDVTHGCLVRARLERVAAGAGVGFRAGEGVGRVTRPGLALPVGEPAINPVPRQMIETTLRELAAIAGGAADFAVELSIPGGEAMAARTLNGRLGIEGGLSILGTTGIVTPYSCSAWIHSIHRSIDVARAVGQPHLAAATGSTSERTVQALHGLPDLALIEMGDFVGATLKYLRRHPVPRLTLAGGFGKLAKLAQGRLDLHSDRSRIDLPALAGELAALGAPAGALDEAARATSAGAVLAIARGHGLPLADRLAGAALEVARGLLDGRTATQLLIVDRVGEVVGRAG